MFSHSVQIYCPSAAGALQQCVGLTPQDPHESTRGCPDSCSQTCGEKLVMEWWITL